MGVLKGQKESHSGTESQFSIRISIETAVSGLRLATTMWRG